MTQDEGHLAGWEGYRAIGLVANPFRLPPKVHAEQAEIRLTTRARAMALLTAIEESLSGDRPRPIRVLKPSELPAYYPRSAMATVLHELGSESETGLLPVYVQLGMMRKGRIRGTLSSFAEMVVARSIEVTLARYTHACISDPDGSLPEWVAVAAQDQEALLARLQEDPAGAAAAIFGPPVDVREDVEGGLVVIMRDSGLRQAHQPADPAEDDESSEEDALDRLDAMVSTEDSEPEAAGESPEEAAAREAGEVAAYVIAHLKKHTSPVIARAVREYVKSGTAAMSQELKITRAPRKTLGALARFARLTFRGAVILYDGFEIWDEVPDDLRALIVSGLAEVRLTLGTNGVMVIAGSEVEAPEIDEQFASAIRVDWTMPELERMSEFEVAYEPELLKEWFEAAVIAGSDTSALWERVEAACANSESMAAGAEIAADVVDSAAAKALGA